MAGSKKWLYQVTGKEDSDPLVIAQENGKDVFKLSLPDGSSEKNISTEASPVINSTTGSGISSLNFVKNNKMKINVQVQDMNSGSGPASLFSVNLKRIYNDKYVSVSEDVKSYTVDYQVCTSETALIDDVVDISGWKLSDGVYEMTFTFKDISGNELNYPSGEKKYFITKDETKPLISKTVPDISSSNSTSYTMSWTPPVDVKETRVSVKVNEGDASVTKLADGCSTK